MAVINTSRLSWKYVLQRGSFKNASNRENTSGFTREDSLMPQKIHARLSDKRDSFPFPFC